jgi:hypothetical protein
MGGVMGGQNDLLWTRQTANSVALGTSLIHVSAKPHKPQAYPEAYKKKLTKKLATFNPPSTV